MKTKFIIQCDSFLAACTVKGYFSEHYVCISSRDSTLEIKLGNEDVAYWVKISADDKFDRAAEFKKSVEYLSSKGVGCHV